MKISVTRVGLGATGRARIRQAKVVRGALLTTTALVGVALASPAAAQTMAVGGGTITANGATVQNPGGGQGVRVTGVTQAEGVTVNGVTINQTVDGPAVAALSIEGASGTTGVTLNGTNNLKTTVSGNAALRITTTGNNFPTFTSSGNVLTGSIGVDLTGPSFVAFSSTGLSQTIIANGTALTGINAVSANATIVDVGNSTISGFATGVNASATNANYASFVSTGGSISATNTGINISAPDGPDVNSQSAITAVTGINAKASAGSVIVKTSGTGTINSTAAGTGTGIIATSSGGSGSVGVTVGAAIGGTTSFATGIAASTTGGTGTITVTNNSAITATTAISVASANAATINLNAGSTTTGSITSTGAGARTINLAGALNGAYAGQLGSGATSFTLASTGSMQAATFGNAADTFTFQGGTIGGTINAGGGTDAFISALGAGNSATLNMTNLTGFESYEHQTGSLTLTGTQSGSSGWTMLPASTITLAGTLNTNGTGITLNGNGAVGAINIASTGTITGFAGANFNSGASNTFNNAGTINTTGYGMVSNGSITATNTGTITSGTYEGVSFGFGTQQLTNSGVITGGSDSADGLGVNTYSTLTVTNQANGRITGGIGGISSGVTSGGTNYGGLLTISNASGAQITGPVAIATQASSGLSLNNSGLVVGSTTAISTNGTGTVGVVNTGTIGSGTVDANGNFTIGGTGNGLNLNAGGSVFNGTTGQIRSASSAILSRAGLSLVNLGTIRGNEVTGGNIGNGLDAVYVTGTASVFNAGLITAATRTGTAQDPTYSGIVAGGAGSVVTNAYNGTLTGGTDPNYGEAVDFLSAGTFNNFGIANGAGAGAVRANAAQAVVVNLFAGSTTGAINLNGGNDTLAIYNGAGTASAGMTYNTATGLFAAGQTTGGTTYIAQQAGTLAAAVVGTINLGGGTDTLMLRGTGDGTAGNGAAGSFSIATNTGAEVLTKADTGTWTLTGAAITPAITINAGTGGLPGSGGLLIFNGTTGLTGSIVVNGGTIRSNSNGAFGTGTIYAADPTIQYAVNTTETNPIVLQTNNATTDPTRLQVGNGVTAILTGLISQGAAGSTNMGGQPTAAIQPLIFEQIGGGTGTFELTNGANNYNGLTTINTGTTVIERNVGTALGSGGVTIGTGATLQIDNQTGTSIGLDAGTYGGAGTLAFTGNAGSVTQVGRDAEGAITTTTISMASGGLFDVRSGEVVGSSSNKGFWTGNLGDLAVAAGATFTTAEGQVSVDTLTGAGRVRIDGSGSLTLGTDNGTGLFTGLIVNQNGAGALTKVGTGTQTLSGGLSYTGGTTITGGTLRIQDTLLPSGTAQIGTGATLEFNFTGGSRIQSNAVIQGTGTLLKTGAGEYRNESAIALSAGGLIDIQGGRFTGSNAEVGRFTNNQGRLNIGAAGFFDGVEGDIFVDGLTGTGRLGGGYQGRGSTTIGVANGSATFDGTITDGQEGTLTLIKAGTGTQTLTGVNTYTRATTISGGTLSLSGAGSITNSALVTNNAIFDIGGVNAPGTSIVNLNGTATTANVALGARTLTITAGSGSYAGTFTGTGGLTVNGAGILQLTGTGNTYSGTTTIGSGETLRGTTATFSPNSTYVDNGTLNFNQAATGSFARAVSGTGTVLVDGGSAGVTLTGAITTANGVQIGANTTAILSNVMTTNNVAVTLIGNAATLNVAQGGTVSSGSNSAVSGTAPTGTVTNAGAILSTTGASAVFFNGALQLTNQSGGLIRTNATGNAVAVRGGAGSGITNEANADITGVAAISLTGGGTGAVTNRGRIQSTGTTGGQNTINLSGTATVINEAGATITTPNGDVAAILSSAGGTFDNRGTITAPYAIYLLGATAGAVTVLNSGTITSNAAGGTAASSQGVFNNSVGAVTVTNSGMLTSFNEGVVLTGARTMAATIGNSGTIMATSNGVSVAGGAATITNTGTIGGGTAAIVLSGNFADTVTLGATSTTNGGVQLGAGNDLLNFAIGAAATGTLDGGADIDNLVVDGAGTATLPTAINFENLIKNGTGTLTLVSDGGFTATSVNAGTLVVNATTGSATVVASGATLTGGGSVGATTVADGGMLANTQGATLTVASLGLSQGSVINATFSAPGGNPLFAVTGDLTLDGTVNVASTTPFGFGLYRLISYGGALTDNGLVVGTTPIDAQRTTVQTSIAGQVNIVSSSSDLLYWDGGNPALYNNGQVNGGTGTWTATSPTFTDANGLFNGAMSPQPGFAIFAAAPGTVTVDGRAGAIAVTGMQFASNGYLVTGDPIGLASPTTAIRVGDGTAAGAGFTATIASALTGANALDKTDLGTLILSGVNSYTGLTTVSGGTLVLAGGRAIDDGGSVQVGAGTTLQLLAAERIASLSGTGAVVLGANTLSLGTNNASSTYGGVASGTGGITQTGTGTLTLGGANTYTGTTLINGGTLAFGASNVLADASTLVVQNGTVNLGANSDTVASFALTTGTLNGTGTLTAASYVLNAGVVNANLGAGTLTNAGGVSALNGTAGAGVVAVNAGTLTLGAANRLADAAVVSVATGAVIDLRTFSDTVGTLALNGTLAGTGTLTAASYTLNGGTANANLGAGTLTNAGGTSNLNGTAAATTVNVNAGTLALGAADRLADAAAVSVASGAVLDLRTFSDTVGTLALNGSLNGTGTLTAATYALNGGTANANLGAGVLTNTGGTSTLNGTAAATTVNVNAGTLALGAADRLADAAAVSVASGAVLDLRTFSDTVGSLALNGTLNGTGTLTAATYALNGATVNGNLGAGVLTNAGGVSTLTGGAGAATVNVTAGTLRLGADERLLDTGAVSVASGATVDLNGRTETVATVNGAGTTALGSGRLVLAGAGASSLGALTGTGTVDKTGTGTLTLASAYASTGSINTGAGTTAFTGTSAGAFRVTGGSLTGTGTAAGALSVTGGTVAPGTAAAPFGTLTVGSLAMTGGTYAIEFGGAASGYASDLIRVTGAAALGGAVSVTPNGFTATDRFQQTYTVVQAGSVTGTFSNLSSFTQSSADPALFYRLRYDLLPNAVVLQVQRQIDFAAAVPNGTANQIAIGRALTGAAGNASDSFAATLNAIAASGGDRGATYDSLSGEAIADVTSSALFVGDRFLDLLRARVGLRGGGTAGAAQYALRAGVTDGQRHANGFAGALADGVEAQGGSASSSGGGVWLQGQGAGQRLRGLPGQARTDSFVSGLAGGIDGQVGHLSIGVAGGFADLDTRVRTRGSTIEGTLYQGGAYVAYDAGTFYGQIAGDYYGGDVRVTRALSIGGTVVGQAAGTTQVRGYTVGGLLGARADLGGGTRAGVELSAQETQGIRRAYTETAPLGLGLTAARDRRDVFTGTAQVKLSHLFTGNGWTAEPFASGGVELHSGDLATVNAMRIGAAPTGTGGFLVQGATIEHTLGVFTGGVEIRPSDKFRIDLSAGGKAGNRTREGQIKVSARVAF